MYLIENNRCIYFTTYAESITYRSVWNSTKTAVFRDQPSTSCLPFGHKVDATSPFCYPEGVELPKGQGWYTKRGVVYLAVCVQREKFVSSTKWRVDDSTLTGDRKSTRLNSSHLGIS